MRLVYAVNTDVGNVRDQNEDYCLANKNLGLFAVADGMGGCAAGEVASKEAIECLHDNVLGQKEVIEQFKTTPNPETADSLRRMLEQSVRSASYQVHGLLDVDASKEGMGTTLSALLLAPNYGFVAHVGDSRIYVIRSNEYRQVTRDHTVANQMVSDGEMSEEEARTSRYSHLLLRAVGSVDYVEVDTRIVKTAVHDIFLLSSDGFHNYLLDGELANQIKPKNLEISSQNLIDLALERGGRDNITVVLVKIEK